jgi:endonuclease III
VFPSIGGPGADRLLLLLHRKKKLAPESNALRVMSRLGWVEETASYSTTYRNANEALRPQLPDDWKTLVSMHQLLKVHGQQVCKPKKPRCASCPLAAGCPRRGLD